MQTFQAGTEVKEYRDLWRGIVLADNGDGTVQVSLHGDTAVRTINARYLRTLDTQEGVNQ
jgi:hypothetical protein